MSKAKEKALESPKPVVKEDPNVRVLVHVAK